MTIVVASICLLSSPEVHFYCIFVCVCVCSATGLRPLTEEQLDSMCPTAAAIAAIVNPGMKFFDVSIVGHSRALCPGLC